MHRQENARCGAYGQCKPSYEVCADLAALAQRFPAVRASQIFCECLPRHDYQLGQLNTVAARSLRPGAGQPHNAVHRRVGDVEVVCDMLLVAASHRVCCSHGRAKTSMRRPCIQAVCRRGES